MRVPLASRQLLFRKGRTLAGLAGIATALLLVLALNAIFAGMEGRLTTYIVRSGAQAIVAQRGVETMHMTESAFPERTVAAVGAVPGVAQVRPILYVAAMLERGNKRGIVYLIGDDVGARPIALSSGRRPGPDEIVLDSVLAQKLGVQPGSQVQALGRTFRVSGEVSGFALPTNSFAFLRRVDLARTIRSVGIVSYVLVRGRPGTSAADLARRINASVPGVTASTRAAFASSERRVVGDMTTDLIRMMILVGFVIGVAVAGLVAYSATLSQLRDYAVLRALGMQARRALVLAVAQVGAMVGAGFVLALALTWLLARLLPQLSPTAVLAIKPGDVVLTMVVAGGVALTAAAFPALRVSRIDPASVFRR